MNKQLILHILGQILLIEAAFMVPSLGISLYLHESDFSAFAISIAILTLISLFLISVKPQSKEMGQKDGFFVATFSWILLALFGSLPFIISGAIPNFVDALFECMSGFTTTGSSVLTDIETLSKSILFWRSLTHWLGGMGVIVLTLALIPSLKVTGMKLFRAEVPGPSKNKILPQVRQTSITLYKVYLILTLIEIAALKIAGLNWFDSFIQTFGSIATGGFSNKNASIAAFNNPTVEYIIIFFMLVGGMNFAVHFYAMRGNFRPMWKDSETRLYLFIASAATIIIAINLFNSLNYQLEVAVREAAFQVVSILTATGFATADYNKWPYFSQAIILLLMFIGGCSGSTAGGIKNIRYIILFKSVYRQIVKIIHPNAVVPVRVGKEVVADEVVGNVHIFFFLYISIITFSTLVLASMGFDLLSSISAVAATMGNIGPGFGVVGPIGNFSSIPALGKLILTFCMLLGRLEIYTVLVVIFNLRLRG